MSEYYIAPDWIDAVRGTTFFYPAAGDDRQEALSVFGDCVNTFLFCDKSYPSGLNDSPQPGAQSRVILYGSCGKFALLNLFSARSIGVFMHRRDSEGEGGSDLWFLAGKSSHTATYGRDMGGMIKELSFRLRDKALVITDGSNSSQAILRQFHWKAKSGRNAFDHHRKEESSFKFGGFRWSCVGWVGNKNLYGPTLVWGLLQLRSSDTDY